MAKPDHIDTESWGRYLAWAYHLERHDAHVISWRCLAATRAINEAMRTFGLPNA